MKSKIDTIFSMGAVVVVTALASENAHAYIDPGTGTLLIQWIFGMVFAGLAVMKIYWAQAKMFFASKFGNAESVDDADGDERKEPTP